MGAGGGLTGLRLPFSGNLFTDQAIDDEAFVARQIT
jgi:hypothetical protein